MNFPVCETCNGDGAVNDYVDGKYQSEVCPNCEGLGYIEDNIEEHEQLKKFRENY